MKRLVKSVLILIVSFVLAGCTVDSDKTIADAENDNKAVTTGEDGNNTLVVGNDDNKTVVIEEDGNNTVSVKDNIFAATSILVGSSISVNTTEADEYFKVDVTGTGILTIYTTGALDTHGYLLDWGGSQVTGDDDSGLDSNFKISRSVSAGTYYIRVGVYSDNNTGSYVLDVDFSSNEKSDDEIINDDYGNNELTASSVETNSTTSGRIEIAGDSDYFKIDVLSSGVLTINTTGTLDSYGYLLDSSGLQVDIDDDNGTDSNFKISRRVTAGTYYVRVRAYSGSEIGNYSLVVDFNGDETSALIAPKQKVVLLLHGLASNADTWKDLVSREYGSQCTTMSTDTTIYNKIDVVSSVKCYRLNFGSYDRLDGLSGLEDQNCTSVNGCSCDYSTFDTLGKEIKEVVSKILDIYDNNAKIILLGHSRGGLAARAFLQEALASLEKESVVGLITTGTPHKGSPLGRSYKYMKDNCLPRSEHDNDNGSCEDDWEVVDMLLGNRPYQKLPFISDGEELDLRAPSIDFLSPESSEIINLNNNIQNLDVLNIQYMQMVYSGKEFGLLKEGGFTEVYKLFGFTFGDHPSAELEDYILNGYSVSSYDGDGIVPTAYQRFGASEFTGTSAIHTDEPKMIEDLQSQLDGMATSLNWTGY